MTTKHATMTCRNARTATTRAPGGPLVSRGGPGTFILREEKKKDDDEEERGIASAVGDSVNDLLG